MLYFAVKFNNMIFTTSDLLQCLVFFVIEVFSRNFVGANIAGVLDVYFVF